MGEKGNPPAGSISQVYIWLFVSLVKWQKIVGATICWKAHRLSCKSMNLSNVNTGESKKKPVNFIRLHYMRLCNMYFEFAIRLRQNGMDFIFFYYKKTN